MAPIFALATMAMLHLGVSGWRILEILLPVFALLMFLTIFLDPGPRAKGLVEEVKSRFH
ncbi:MAG: hypothetical protein WAN60_06880 [Candidatus Sulfotelmatobacter sp.]